MGKGFPDSDNIDRNAIVGSELAKLLPAAIWPADFPDNQESRLAKLAQRPIIVCVLSDVLSANRAGTFVSRPRR